MIKFVDLFAGIGGIRKGLELATEQNGILSQCVFSSEIDPRSQATYSLNYGEQPEGDIRQIDTLPSHDVLLAGFPCQAFSYAGKQKGFADIRGTLFFEIERLLTSIKKKPELLILENVRGFKTHDKGRTYETVISKIESLGYKTKTLLLNSSNFGVPQNRVRVYIVCTLNRSPVVSIQSDLGAADSHKFKKSSSQISLFDFFDTTIKSFPKVYVGDILEPNVDKKYICSKEFRSQLSEALHGQSFDALHGVRLIDYRGGNSLHSWDLGIKGRCSPEEKSLMNAIIANRRKKHFGTQQDGKELTINQIETFWDEPNLSNLLDSLVLKGYLRLIKGKYNPTCGNMSFEVFKFLDPKSISITVVTSDAHRLGVVHNGVPRRITPRECARLQGFPDDFKLHPENLWAYRQLGNSVSVPVITEIFNDLIVNNNEPFKKAVNKTTQQIDVPGFTRYVPENL